MSYLSNLLALAGVQALAVMSPGPNFVATVHHAIARSRRDGMLVAFGIATATTIWVILSIAGLGIVFVRFSWLVEIIRTIGALYITFLGMRMIWTAHRQKRSRESEAILVPQGSAWRMGFLTNVSNPKTAAFFTSLFALLLPTHPPLWFQIACIVTIVLISASWYTLVACLFSWKSVASAYRRAKRWIDTITGCILIVLGACLAGSK